MKKILVTVIGLSTIFVFILLICFGLSCTKDQIGENPKPELKKYQAYIDHYSKDQTKMGVRTLVAQYYLPQDRNGGIDTMKNQVLLNCVTDSIEHWYYKVNDKMNFQAEVNMKLIPSRIDTIFINYNKN